MTKTKVSKQPVKKQPAKKQPDAKLYPAKHYGDMATWICTPFGIFYPAVRPAATIAEGDPRTMQVRARRSEYLDALRQHFCPELGPNEHNPAGRKMDYPWRAYVAPVDLARAMAAIILAHDSEVFKPLAESSKYALPDRKQRSALHGVYNGMWSRQLDVSDGTSSYDHPKGKGTYGSSTYSSPQRCRTLNHWYPRGKAKCVDCGKPKPKGQKGTSSPWVKGDGKYICRALGGCLFDDSGVCEDCGSKRPAPLAQLLQEPEPEVSHGLGFPTPLGSSIRRCKDCQAVLGEFDDQCPWCDPDAYPEVSFYKDGDGEEYWPRAQKAEDWEAALTAAEAADGD